MGLIFRVSSSANTGATYIKNAALEFDEGDGNFAWLAANLSASVVEISGSVQLSGSFSIPSLTTVAQSNVITVDTTTGRLYYTASSAVGAGALTTSSFLITASATNNTLTFTKGDNSTFNVLVATGSAANTGSFMITGSVSNNTLTFTKGDNTTFNLTVNTGSIPVVVMAVSSSGSTIYSVNPATSNFNTSTSIFLGTQAGASAVNASNSNFIGVTAGYSASYSNASNFIGDEAGYNAFSASISNFIGKGAGNGAINADNSNFIGFNAGYQASFAYSSNFMGLYAGDSATSASYSTFLGFNAGRNFAGTGVKSNNIIIGTNITFENDRKDSINLGGVIFATGSYSTLSGTPFSGSVTNARVGINKSLPQYTLDVSGSVGVATILNIASSDPLPAGSIGNIAVSASNLYFYSASAWYQVQLV